MGKNRERSHGKMSEEPEVRRTGARLDGGLLARRAADREFASQAR
jgi:hypothetical protein